MPPLGCRFYASIYGFDERRFLENSYRKVREVDLKWSYLCGDFDLSWGGDVLLESRESSTAKKISSVAKGELERWLM
jgi:hypothetical protein